MQPSHAVPRVYLADDRVLRFLDKSPEFQQLPQAIASAARHALAAR